MADQVEIVLPKTVYPERTSFTATAYFRTRATGAASTPTTVEYRIDNITTRTTVTDWTTVTPGNSVSITVKSGENTIESSTGHAFSGFPKWEKLQLTVSADRNLDTEVNNIRQWRCNNIFGVT